MKKYLLLIVILISSINIYAQNYTFNLLTNYKSENGFYQEKAVFSNKENNSYFLIIREFENQKTAYLRDLNSFNTHQFKVIEPTTNGKDTTTQFEYVTSYKIKKRDDIPTTHDFKIVQRDSLLKTVKITTYRNKNRKKIINTAEFKIKDSPYNLFPVFRYSCLHPYEESNDFNFNENGMVESYKGFDGKEPIFIYLDYFMNIKEFELKIKS